jgi:hypothetical protein
VYIVIIRNAWFHYLTVTDIQGVEVLRVGVWGVGIQGVEV